ncbi:Unknown protein sequence [Pseudomonas coronafaciens pv. oryzae]|nr:Unknown protein sequence [Pseudomonas coronafaciens pv. oryzae]
MPPPAHAIDFAKKRALNHYAGDVAKKQYLSAHPDSDTREC